MTWPIITTKTERRPALLTVEQINELADAGMRTGKWNAMGIAWRPPTTDELKAFVIGEAKKEHKSFVLVTGYTYHKGHWARLDTANSTLRIPSYSSAEIDALFKLWKAMKEKGKK